jgi:hypothetical protein
VVVVAAGPACEPAGPVQAIPKDLMSCRLLLLCMLWCAVLVVVQLQVFQQLGSTCLN